MKAKRVCLKVASILQIVTSGLIILDFVEELFTYLKLTSFISAISFLGVLYIGAIAGLLLADGILMFRVSCNDEWLKTRQKYNLVLGVIILCFIPVNSILSWFSSYALVLQSFTLLYIAIGVLRIVSSSLKEKQEQKVQNVQQQDPQSTNISYTNFDSKFEQIQKLAELKQLGLISEQEFNQMKNNILNK